MLRRFRRKHGIEEMQKTVKVQPFVFDILYLDGETLIDLPFSERRARLEATVSDYVTPQLVNDDPDAIERFYNGSLAAGHEGLMLKVLSAPY
ncbi:ATP-dependent DNA ligase, partial [Klebsiella variicola]|uniref:ATP-dependent DNA ligase n=1 Tax=Klebsiella variicola TaxID=244366 RepID=UPI002775CF40|nr:DNA ligase [Klebsiella variicola]